MASHEDLIEQFKAITGTESDSRAKFFLETANWQLDLAANSFYDNGGADLMETEEDAPPPYFAANPIASAGATADAEFNRDDGLEAWMRTQKTKPKSRNEDKREDKQGKPANKPSSRFASLSDYSSAPQPDSDDDEGQSYYAGGSENSGELIVGPSKKKKDIVEQMFKDAKKHGAQTLNHSQHLEKEKKASSHFTGGGYKLGETSSDHQFVPGQESAQEQRQLDVVLRLWQNGFTVGDDGELRNFNDPANREFLDHIRKGEIPPELTRMAKGGVVNLDMEDHRNEDYQKPKAKLKPFTGEGHKLGSPVPDVVANTPAAMAQTSSVDPEVIIDESQPTTTIQLRLANGTKIKQKFNHSHTVADVRNFVLDQNPQSASRAFVLMTTFPNKELTDFNLTLSDGNLLNTVIVQRYK